jgi:hypothetical protein
MRDHGVRRLRQPSLAFERQEVWQALPPHVQQQCGDLIGQLLRGVLQLETAPRSHDERQDPTRSS